MAGGRLQALHICLLRKLPLSILCMVFPRKLSPWQTSTLNTLCRAPLENYNCPTPKTTAPINSLYTVLFKYLHLSQFNSLRALFKQQ